VHLGRGRGDALGRRSLAGCRGSRPGLGQWTRGQERQRIHVALLIGRPAYSEVHVRLGQIDRSARADRADDRAFIDGSSARDTDRAQVDERRRVAEGGLDRDGLPAGRDRAGEGHDTLRRGNDVRAGRCADLKAAMLAARVRVRLVERKRPQQRAVDRPGPGIGCRNGQHERAQDQRNSKSPHESSSSLLSELRTVRP
jgi:hypothetical protein